MGLTNIVVHFKNLLIECLTALSDAFNASDSTLLLYILAGITVWVGSACLASSIAEHKGYKPGKHVAAGLLIPIIYPLLALGLKSLKKSADELEPKIKKFSPGHAAVLAKKEAKQTKESSKGEEAWEDDGLPFGNIFFKEQRSLCEDGDIAGWRIRFAGNDIIASQIIDVLEEVVVLGVRDGKGGTQTMRVPYAKIDACKQI